MGPTRSEPPARPRTTARGARGLLRCVLGQKHPKDAIPQPHRAGSPDSASPARVNPDPCPELSQHKGGDVTARGQEGHRRRGGGRWHAAPPQLHFGLRPPKAGAR